MKFYYHFFVGENWSISELFLTYGNYKCNVLYLNLSGLVKVQGNTDGGGGLKYYLFEKFRVDLLKNIKKS